MGRKLELAAEEDFQSLQGKVGSLDDIKAVNAEGNPVLCTEAQALELSHILAAMPRLQELNLSGCSLSCECIKALAPGLRSSTELERLILSHNNFGAAGVTSLVDEVFPCLASLRELSLQGCRLNAAGARRLAGGLRRLLRLEALWLGGNIFGEEGLRALVEDALPVLQSLRRLDLTNLVRLGEPEGERLAQGLAECTGLTDFSAAATGLAPQALQLLAPGLSACCRLRRLHLQSNNLGAKGASLLADAVLPNLPEVVVLDVSYCDFDSAAVVELSLGLLHLRSLERFSLAGNEFGVDGATALATAAFGRLGELKELDLSDCALDAAATQELAPAFQLIKGLQVLRYRGNHFGTGGATALSAEALPHLANLRVLDVRRCDLTRPAVEALAVGTSQMPALETLDFGERKVMGQYVRGLSLGKDWTPRQQKLKCLDLEGSGLGSSFLAKTVASFQYLTELETLNFKGNDFGGNFVEVLASDGLPQLLGLRDLNLTDCSIGPAAMQVLAANLGKLASLDKLNLRGNDMGEKGARSLSEHAFPQLPTLKELVLAHCDLDSASMAALAPGLAHLAGLEKLVVAFNEFEGEGLEALAVHALPHLLNLLELNLCSCGLESSQVEQHLAAPLGQLVSLEKLVLTSNEVGTEGGKALALQAFPQLTRLRELELAHCLLDATAATDLLPSLRHLTSLQKLNLMGNKLGLAGAQALASEALPKLLALTELNFSYGGFGAEAIKELVPSLRLLKNLEHLMLRNNQFETKGAEVLATGALKDLGRLQSLDLRLTGIREHTMDLFVPGVARLAFLRSLEFGDKRILAAFISTLPKCLTADGVNLFSFREIALDKCELTGEAVEELVPGLRLLTSLEVLSFRANEGFGMEGAKALALALADLPKLRELHLSNCGLTCDAMPELARSIGQLLNLEVLNLMNNNLGDAGGKALLDAVLPFILRAREINVLGCGFSEEVKDAVGAARPAGSGLVG